MGVYKKENRWYIDYYQPDGKRKREVVTITGINLLQCFTTKEPFEYFD